MTCGHYHPGAKALAGRDWDQKSQRASGRSKGHHCPRTHAHIACPLPYCEAFYDPNAG